MAVHRAPPKADELLEALAAALAAGLSNRDALSLLAATGPASAASARRIEEQLKDGSLAKALTAAGLVAPDEAAVVAVGESEGRLAAALNWAVKRARTRRERRRAIVGGVIGPMAFAALTLLSTPLPSLAMGGGAASLAGAVKSTLELLFGAAAALWGIPWLFAHPKLGPTARSVAARLPFGGSLLRLAGETEAAAIVASFADATQLGAAPAAARAIVPAPYADALAAAAADPQLRAVAFSESFGLALAVGARTGELRARLAAFHDDGQRRLTARLRNMARVVSYVVAVAVAAQGALKLLSTPLGGVDLGGVGNSPEMRELERELDNAGH